jgi:MAC/Perforin domain
MGQVATPNPSDESFPFPGLAYLGCGYDVFGKYASKDSIKGQLFDFRNEKMVKEQFLDLGVPAEQMSHAFTSTPTEVKLCYSRYEKAQYKSVFEGEMEYQSSGSMTDEHQTMSAQVGLSADYGAFGGELNARYDTTKTRLDTTKFYSATAIVRYYELTMGNFPLPELHPDQLPLDETFKEDLNDKNIDPEKLFDAYGTHYIFAVTIGCRIVYGHTVDTSKVQTTYNAEADMKAKYEGAGVSAGGSISDDSQKETDFEHIKLTTEGLQGGVSESKLPLSQLKGGWHNPVLIDFPSDGSQGGPKALKGIWLLCADTDRRAALEDAFTKYATKRGGVAIAAIAAPDLIPVYLLHRTDDPTCVYYRLSRNVYQPENAIGQWKAVKTDPWFYAFVEQQPGTVPLYEYYCDQPSSCAFRYETGSWDPYLNVCNQRWVKNSSTPLGYVYDGIDLREFSHVSIEQAPNDAVPVYAYYRKSCAGDHFGCYYSTDSADSRDNGGWRPMKIPADDGHGDNAPGFPYDPSPGEQIPDYIKPMFLKTNVHWLGSQLKS